jgi:hypothetical protein
MFGGSSQAGGQDADVLDQFGWFEDAQLEAECGGAEGGRDFVGDLQ